MKNFKKLGTTVVIIGIIIFIFSSIVILRPWHSNPAAHETVRVAYLPIYVDLPLFVAEKNKLFKERGLKVELTRFQSSPDMAAALLSGDVDVIASIATSSALSIETRDPGKFKVFLVDAETPENPLSSLLVSSKSNINNPIELKGGIIASFPGPTASLFAPLAFKKYGLDKQDYQIQEMSIGNHITALETGTVDAVVTYEPTATQAVVKYGSKKLVSGFIENNVINPWQAGIWIISTQYLASNRKNAEKFIRSIYDAVDLIRKNPKKEKEALSSFTSINLDIAYLTPNIPFTKFSEVNLVTLQRHSDLLTQNGVLSKTVDIPPLMINVLPNHN